MQRNSVAAGAGSGQPSRAKRVCTLLARHVFVDRLLKQHGRRGKTHSSRRPRMPHAPSELRRPTMTFLCTGVAPDASNRSTACCSTCRAPAHAVCRHPPAQFTHHSVLHGTLIKQASSAWSRLRPTTGKGASASTLPCRPRCRRRRISDEARPPGHKCPPRETSHLHWAYCARAVPAVASFQRSARVAIPRHTQHAGGAIERRRRHLPHREFH